MDNKIKITKLPDECDPDRILEKMILEKYGKCPFCDGNPMIPTVTTWYGKQRELPFLKKIFSKSGYWGIMHFVCSECGAKWDTPSYPRYLGTYKSK